MPAALAMRRALALASSISPLTSPVMFSEMRLISSPMEG